MVVCVDKYTAVKMFDLVSFYLEEEKKNIIAERNQSKTIEERDNFDKMLRYIDFIKMAVVISDDGDDENLLYTVLT